MYEWRRIDYRPDISLVECLAWLIPQDKALLRGEVSAGRHATPVEGGRGPCCWLITQPPAPVVWPPPSCCERYRPSVWSILYSLLNGYTLQSTERVYLRVYWRSILMLACDVSCKHNSGLQVTSHTMTTRGKKKTYRIFPNCEENKRRKVCWAVSCNPPTTTVLKITLDRPGSAVFTDVN